MYDRILLPTDGSDAGVEVSLQHAIAQAQAFGATLHILYVTDSDISDSSSFMGEKSPAGKGATKRVKDRAEERGVKTETAVVQGEPEEEIVDYARKQAIDLIVMGTHGRTGISRVLGGSVTEEVVRKSRKPVLAVERKD